MESNGKQFNFIDKYGFIFAGCFLLGGTWLFYSQSGQLGFSLIAATIGAAVAWVAWVLTRWLILALK